MKSEFERENRYIVVKRSDLDKLYKDPTKYATTFGHALALIAPHLPKRQFLVIESDWPEYEPAWKMIEARMTGAPASPQAAQPVAVYRFRNGNPEHLVSWNALPDGDHALYTNADASELAHMTTLRDTWYEQYQELKASNKTLRAQLAERDALLQLGLTMINRGIVSWDDQIEYRQKLAALFTTAKPEVCKTCNGSKLVDDGEMTHSELGVPYENGPIKCVKDCPDCSAPEVKP